MYDKRIKIFVIIIAALLLIILLRLVQMQLLPDSSIQEQIADLKARGGRYQQLNTIRGKIFDRNNRVLALDISQFGLYIDYKLTSLADQRVTPEEDPEYDIEDLQQIIDKCAQLRAVEPAQIAEEIKGINDFIWGQRTFAAWRENFSDSQLFKEYDNVKKIPLSRALADFEAKEPVPAKRLELVNKTDLAEMHKDWPLIDLATDDDIFAAQFEFMNIQGIKILPQLKRSYPFRYAAAQTIGWVGLPQETDKRLFEDDRLLNYRSDDVCGREDGVEYVCETILRGRRGEIFTDIDGQQINHAETQFGKDITLTIDIELQQRIAEHLTDPDNNLEYYRKPMAVVVIDIASSDILALVSLPTYDLNRIRYDWTPLAADANEPLRNRTINKRYPPGSAIKPIILIAGLESGKITPDQAISCPSTPPPQRPRCWREKNFHIGHDQQWEYEGLNSAHNALRGSCNIYFARLAERIDPDVLQQWLFNFGYGQQLPLAPPGTARNGSARTFRQMAGVISSGGIEDGNASLKETDRKWFGIGQGDLRVTPLQVANMMAAIARGGLYRTPRLFLDSNPSNIDLNISPNTLTVVRGGMSAVVNDVYGTAHEPFTHTNFAERGVTVYGKTGSTENPDNAWFAGFAQDRMGRGISIAIVVEGGQHASTDAAPLARDIIQFCIEADYIGKNQLSPE